MNKPSVSTSTSSNTIKIPKFFHELFGQAQRPLELIGVLAFVIVSSIVMTLFFVDDLSTLNWFQGLVLWLLYFDISGGVVANLTWGTNAHYGASAKGRWLFIAIHVQPLILGWALQLDMVPISAVWLYTIVSASGVNLLYRAPYQRVIAGALMSMGLIMVVAMGKGLSPFVLIVLMLYMVKVVYSFGVNHDGR